MAASMSAGGAGPICAIPPARPRVNHILRPSKSTLPDSRARNHAILTALRESDGGYEATRIPEVKTDPGGEVAFIARVTNLSPIVDRIALRVDGMPDGWAEVRPSVLHLLPFRSSGEGHEAGAEVRARFPRSPEAESGAWPVRVVAYSSVYGRRVASAPAIVA